MRVAINTRFGNYAYREGYGHFIREIADRLVAAHPADAYFFYADRPFPGSDNCPANLHRRVAGPPARHPLLWKYWYDLRIPALLARDKADVFFSPDGICSLTTARPQVLAIHDLAFLHYPAFLPRQQQWFYQYYTPRFIRKAARIITVSEWSKADIIRQYPFAKGKVEVVYNAADKAFRPRSYAEKEAWKEQFTDGREYFLCVGSIHPRKNLINLLKAFSLFKKRQRTNMLLVITGRMAWQHEPFQQALSTFKYREDVKLTGYLPQDQLSALMAAAYALVAPSLWEGFGIPVLEAMQSGVPVLCADNSAMPEVAGGSALTFDPLQPVAMAEQMARIYKDEPERERLISLGLTRAGHFNWDDTATRVREILQTAASTGGNPYLRT